MLHKVVWQHTQCVVGPIIITYCKFTKWKNFEDRLHLTELGPWVWCAVFCPPYDTMLHNKSPSHASHGRDMLLQTEWRGLPSVLVKTVNSAKTDEPIQMPFGDRLEWAQGTMHWMGRRSPNENEHFWGRGMCRPISVKGIRTPTIFG